MQNLKLKMATTIAIILLMASLTLITIPPANAASSVEWHGTTAADRAKWPLIPHLGPLTAGVTPAYTLTSKAYLSFTPNPIGVGQMLLVNVWTSPGMYHAFYMQGYTVFIQKPNGDTETIGPYESYMADATAWFNYIPDQVGTYKFKFESAGTYLPAGDYKDSPTGGAFFALAGNYTLGASVYYTPASTDWQELTVQEDMVASYPPAALPTDYWTRPIYPDKREWYPIAGNYPFTGAVYYDSRVLYASNYKYTAYVQAPNSAHIVWRKLGNIAGLIGGEQYQYSLSASPGTPSIIFSGRCYQTLGKVVNGQAKNIWECYDLRTGEVYWDIEAPTVTTMGMFGPATTVLAPSFISYEQSTSEAVPGALASQGFSVYLVAVAGGRLIKYNPYTGSAAVNVSLPTEISSATVTYAPYVLTLQTINATTGNYRLINWTIAGTSTNFTTRIMSNITWGSNPTYPMTSIGSLDLDAGVAVYGWWSTPPGPQWCIGHFLQAVDLRTGQTLWIDQNNDTTTENMQGAGFVVVDRGKVAFGAHDMAWSAWDSRTGQKLWTSEKTDYPWGAWFPYSTSSYDFNESKGAIITSTYEGIYAIDWDDGKILWHWQDPTIPFEDPYGGYGPFFTTVTSADGKIFAYNGEHSPSQPLTRNWRTFCLNATTGELVWSIVGPMVPGAVADGYLTAANSYDGYMYVFGKGKSETTITTSPKTIANGAQVLIEGSVLDQSPGMPNTPCVSKDSMTTQMEYLYEQKPIDGIWHNETINGVPVALTAIDANGNVIDIGTTTSNGYYGTFSLAWTPPSEGVYTIMASFAGDDSYGSSTAATAVSVGPAPPTIAPTPTPIAQTDYAPTLMGILAAVVVAIIISVIALVAVIKKRP